MSRDPIPTLDDAYLALAQEELSKGIALDKAAKDDLHTQGVFAVQTTRYVSRFDKQDKSKLLCYHCDQKGHDMKLLFPASWIPGVVRGDACSVWENRNQ